MDHETIASKIDTFKKSFSYLRLNCNGCFIYELISGLKHLAAIQSRCSQGQHRKAVNRDAFYDSKSCLIQAVSFAITTTTPLRQNTQHKPNMKQMRRQISSQSKCVDQSFCSTSCVCARPHRRSVTRFGIGGSRVGGVTGTVIVGGAVCSVCTAVLWKLCFSV